VDEGKADARIYAALAFGYAALGHSPYPEGMFEASKEAAQRAMALDDSIPEIYLALGMHALYYDWNFDVADAQLQRALELNPSLTATVYHYAWLMELWQYSDRALPFGDKTAELDPLSPYILFTLAEQYRNAGLYDEAIRIADEAIALNAQHAGAISTKAGSIAMQGDFESALTILEPVKDALPWGARYGAVLALAGREQEARDYLETIEKVPRNVLALVFVYSALGDNDEVFHWMNVAKETKLPWYPWLITWFPNMDSMRNDPRMDAVAAELELTEALARARALGR
jgi:tetratricopeptide (TPR) repeat protein